MLFIAEEYYISQRDQEWKSRRDFIMYKVKKIIASITLCGILAASTGTFVTMAAPVTRTGMRKMIATATSATYYSYTSTPGKNSTGKAIKNTVMAYIDRKGTAKYSTKTGANNVTSEGTYNRGNAYHGIGNDIYSLDEWMQN